MTADSPSCKYTARLERDGDRYVVEIPSREIELGSLSPGDVCQVTVDLLEEGAPEASTTGSATDQTDGSDGPDQPVTVGERLTVQIDDMGQQGDGIARVGEGYVLIVPGSDVDDEVEVEVQHTNPTYGFAEILDDQGDDAGTDEETTDESEATDEPETDDTATDESGSEANPSDAV